MNIIKFDNFRLRRKEMVEQQLISNGIDQEEVINAFLTVPRHEFVPDEVKDKSYSDTPLPIGYSQTISQPFVIAYMIQVLELKSGHRVLEVGTGSGYQTALLCEMGCEVFTVELIDELSSRAEQTLKLLGYRNVRFKVGDGHYGFEEGSPYDRIIVSAASEDIPDSLVEQLEENGGKLIIPVGEKKQQLILVKKSGNEAEKKVLTSVKFVPLIKKEKD